MGQGGQTAQRRPKILILYRPEIAEHTPDINQN